MLDHPTLDLLHELGLQGMAHGFRELAQNPEAGNLQHGEWLAILLEHEATLRRQKRFEARARTARLRHAARCRRHRLSCPARARSRAVTQALRLRLGPPTPQSAGDRADRHRQELDRLCAGAQGLPREPLGALSARPAADGGTRSRPRRRPLCQAVALAGPGQSADPRRLGTRAARPRAAPRSAGDRRGPL